MEERKVIITNESGLHARPAAQLSNFVKGFEGSVTIKCGEKSGDAKSILNLLSMGIKETAKSQSKLMVWMKHASQTHSSRSWKN